MAAKPRITDENELLEAVTQSISSITQSVKEEVGELEVEYTKYRRRQRLGVLLIAAAFLLPNLVIFLMEIFATGITSWWSNAINILVFTSSVVVFGYFGLLMIISGVEKIKKFHGSVDRVLFLKTFALLEVEGSLIEHSATFDEREFPDTKWGRFQKRWVIFTKQINESKEATLALETLRQSELITEPFNVTKVDNLFRIKINGMILNGVELDIKNITGSGKSRTVKEIFKGYFLSYELPHTLDGKTFVSTEGDTYGFGHRTFWSVATEGGAVETTLEWNDFEELLHVATTDKVEARYILTPRFMSELHDWWKPLGTNVRMSFIQNRFSMMYPDGQIRIDDSVDKINEEEIKHYILSIAKPLLHVVRLIEGVRMT